MNFKKYHRITGEKGLYYGGGRALADALGEGVISLVQTACCQPGAMEFLRVGWEVSITFPRQPSLRFHLGNYSERKKAESVVQAALREQERIKGEKKAAAAAERAKNRQIKQQVREEMARVAAMASEEQLAYWEEEARKRTENLRRWQEALQRLKT